MSEYFRKVEDKHNPLVNGPKPVRVSVEVKTELLRGFDLSYIELQFLQKAVDTLKQCRRTPMNTYAFAFYAKKNHQQARFEVNQSDLETATETLSKQLEAEGETVADIKQKFQDQANYCESRRKVLVEHVHEWYEKEW
ncbi:hypothetical protein RvY_14318-1 [Ramazzottius varieornatus]|uniref:Uncharacterized protein n=1 Tax=Ramazzottius varieornatus TaxID=947166 RepID=A0A1D1VY70_RAMVA|nr:hypothetical protein RvY_14318-1 [Ramazzottius varieornatus]